MRNFNFDMDSGTEITKFNSVQSTFSRVIQHNKPEHIGCFHIGFKGIVRSHPQRYINYFSVKWSRLGSR